VTRTWLGWVAFFFAASFVIHAMVLLVHEIGGHALAMKIVACGVEGVDLTYFAGGLVRPTPCPPPWLWRTFAITSSAGILVTLCTGAVAAAFQRRAGLSPLLRVLLALLATYCLLGQLWYATAGGYHAVMDPAPIALMLDLRGLHLLAWLPPLGLYAVAVPYCARALVDALRDHFGSRSRLQALKHILVTLGVAELLFVAALRVEAALRTDAFHSITVAAEQRAATTNETPWARIHSFPIRYVLLAIAVAAFAHALARPLVPGEGGPEETPQPVPPRYAVGVAVAALVCAGAITLLSHL
jgi:hypothetical protein